MIWFKNRIANLKIYHRFTQIDAPSVQGFNGFAVQWHYVPFKSSTMVQSLRRSKVQQWFKAFGVQGFNNGSKVQWHYVPFKSSTCSLLIQLRCLFCRRSA